MSHAAETIRPGPQPAPSAGKEAVSETVIVDENPETLIDERRTVEHPAPFGLPGRPLRRNSPFYYGFFGALGVLLAYFLARAVVNARPVLVLIVVSMFLAIGLNPLVERLIRYGLRRSAAVAAVFIGAVATVAGLASQIIPPVIEQTSTFVLTLPAKLEQLQQSETIAEFNARWGLIDQAQAYVSTSNLGARIAGGVVGLGWALVGAVFSALTVMILTLYFLVSLPAIKRQIYELVPASRRTRVTLLGDEILLRIGGYVSGAFTVSLISGGASYVFLAIAGIPYAVPLAILTALLSLIPMVGATVALILVSAVAFFQSVPVGVATIVYYTVYQQVENYYVYPRVMRRSVDVPPAITVIAALIGGALLGVVGALIAIPTAAAVLLLVREVLVPRQDHI